MRASRQREQAVQIDQREIQRAQYHADFTNTLQRIDRHGTRADPVRQGVLDRGVDSEAKVTVIHDFQYITYKAPTISDLSP